MDDWLRLWFVGLVEVENVSWVVGRYVRRLWVCVWGVVYVEEKFG